MRNPDKYIRLYLFNLLNNITVDGLTIRCYDSHSPNNDSKALIVLSTQSGRETQTNKCGKDVESNIIVDIITRYPLNSGSRLLADNIKEKVLELTENPLIDNFTVQGVTIEFPSDLTQDSSTETIFRKLIKFNFKLS